MSPAPLSHPHPGAPSRGDVVWEYRPPKAHPILYAGLLLTLAVFAMGGLENLLRARSEALLLVYAAPPAAVALLMLLLQPSPVRIHENGLAPSRPLLLRWHRPFIAWDDVAAAYPVHYDVTGAFVSPFASSDGKVTLFGLGLEERGGRLETVRFTPTRFAQNTRRTRGYREAWPIVEGAFARLGKPLVPSAQTFNPGERARLEVRAKAPFLPFFAIVFLFACAAPVLLLLLKAGLPEWAALPIALAFPLATSLRSWVQSRRRNRILNALSKAAAYERSRTTGEAPGPRPARGGVPDGPLDGPPDGPPDGPYPAPVAVHA